MALAEETVRVVNPIKIESKLLDCSVPGLLAPRRSR